MISRIMRPLRGNLPPLPSRYPTIPLVRRSASSALPLQVRPLVSTLISLFQARPRPRALSVRDLFAPMTFPRPSLVRLSPVPLSEVPSSSPPTRGDRVIALASPVRTQPLSPAESIPFMVAIPQPVTRLQQIARPFHLFHLFQRPHVRERTALGPPLAPRVVAAPSQHCLIAHRQKTAVECPVVTRSTACPTSRASSRPFRPLPRHRRPHLPRLTHLRFLLASQRNVAAGTSLTHCPRMTIVA